MPERLIEAIRASRVKESAQTPQPRSAARRASLASQRSGLLLALQLYAHPPTSRQRALLRACGQPHRFRDSERLLEAFECRFLGQIAPGELHTCDSADASIADCQGVDPPNDRRRRPWIAPRHLVRGSFLTRGPEDLRLSNGRHAELRTLSNTYLSSSADGTRGASRIGTAEARSRPPFGSLISGAAQFFPRSRLFADEGVAVGRLGIVGWGSRSSRMEVPTRPSDGRPRTVLVC